MIPFLTAAGLLSCPQELVVCIYKQDQLWLMVAQWYNMYTTVEDPTKRWTSALHNLHGELFPQLDRDQWMQGEGDHDLLA